MALTRSFTTPDARTSPAAYAVIDGIAGSKFAQRATVSVNIYHDQAAREAQAAPIHVVTVEFYAHPNVPGWDRVETARQKAERDEAALRSEAALCLHLDPENQAGYDALIAQADAKMPDFEGARDEALGDDWQQRYPTYEDLFSAEQLDQTNPYAKFYEWAQAYHPLFSDGWEAV